MVQARRSIRRRAREDVHLHAAAAAVGRRGEVGVVGAGGVLRFGPDPIAADPAPAEVVVLEVARRLGEPQQIETVVIDDSSSRTCRSLRRSDTGTVERFVGLRVVRQSKTRLEGVQMTGASTPSVPSRSMPASTLLPSVTVGAVGHPSQVVERVRRFVADQRLNASAAMNGAWVPWPGSTGASATAAPGCRRCRRGRSPIASGSSSGSCGTAPCRPRRRAG